VKRIALISIILLFIMFPVSVFAILPGDIDNSGKINLKDAIISLQIISGMNVIIPVYVSADVNGDNKIGIAEVIYALQCIARLRNNHSPVLSPIGNKTIDENATLNIILTATDEDNDPLIFVISPLPNGATFNAITQTFSWTPSYSQSGTYQITFKADDGYGGISSETIDIVVNNKNGAPILTLIDNKIIDEGSTLTFSISSTDPDGDTLTYSTSSLPNGATFNATTRTFSWTPTYTQSGTYLATFSANDGHGGIDSKTITITVNNVNRSPMLNSIGNKSVDENMIITFIISATDPDGDTLTYSASSLPNGAIFNPSTRTFLWIPTYSQSGFYPVTFFANDGYGGIDSKTITITVNNVAPPELFQSLSANVFTGGHRDIGKRVTNSGGDMINSCGYMEPFYDRATTEESLAKVGGYVTSSSSTEWCGTGAGESGCLKQFGRVFVFDSRYQSPQQTTIDLYMTGLLANRMTVIKYDSHTYNFSNGEYEPTTIVESSSLDTSILKGYTNCIDQQPTQTKDAIDGNWTGYKATYSPITMNGATAAATVSCVNQSCTTFDSAGVTFTLPDFNSGTWKTADGAPKLAGAAISADRQLLSMFVCSAPLDESKTFENCSFFTLKR
jgi:hypothetical protein